MSPNAAWKAPAVKLSAAVTVSLCFLSVVPLRLLLANYHRRIHKNIPLLVLGFFLLMLKELDSLPEHHFVFTVSRNVTSFGFGIWCDRWIDLCFNQIF